MKVERKEGGARMSQIVVHGDTVYLAGIVANTERDGTTVVSIDGGDGGGHRAAARGAGPVTAHGEAADAARPRPHGHARAVASLPAPSSSDAALQRGPSISRFVVCLIEYFPPTWSGRSLNQQTIASIS